jgi:hypothetical protein
VVWAERQSIGPGVAALPERVRQRFAALLGREAEALTTLAPLAGEATLALQSNSRSWTGRLQLLRRAARDPGTLFLLSWWLTRRLARSIALAPSLWLATASARSTKVGQLSVGSHG